MNKLQIISGMGISQFLALLACLLLLKGCASASPVHMIPESFDIDTRFVESVSVVVDTSGANKHYHEWVESGAFQNALEESLIRSRLFSRIEEGSASAYGLSVRITSVGNFWGLTAKLTINTAWALKDNRSGTVVWKDVVRSDGIATMGDATGGAKRVSIAYERAIKENIRVGIKLLSTSEVSGI